jgi:hypothetical protein
VPRRARTAPTDNGARFAGSLPAGEGPGAEAATGAIRAARGGPGPHRVHAFDRACERRGGERRLTKPRHPWTDGRVERMDRAP